MRVAINISPIRGAHRYRGIGIYTKLLVKHLQLVDKQNEYILTTKTSLANIDLIHYPYFDFYFLTLPFIKLKPVVLPIQDVHPLLFPEHYPPGLRGRVKFSLQRWSLRGVKAVITDSDCSRKDIARFLPVPKDSIHRVYLAADPALKPQPYSRQKQIRERFQLTKPYFLYVGDISYNKNLAYLLTNFKPYAKDFDLVLVSRALAKNIPEARAIKAQIATDGLEATGRLITDLADEPNLLACLYSGAYWYIQPSLYEGFGLPVVEAMQCGTPVISSTGGSLPEVMGEVGISFDPQQPQALELAIAQVIVMTKGKRQRFVEKGLAQAAKFSWEKTARETVAIYQQVVAKSHAPST